MVAPLLLIVNHFPQCYSSLVSWYAANVSRETFTNFKNDIQSKNNYKTVLVAFD